MMFLDYKCETSSKTQKRTYKLLIIVQMERELRYHKESVS